MAFSILIVEDSPVQRGILEDLVFEVLPDADLESMDAADKALHRLKSPPAPDVVLTDFNMPGKNGVLFTREARQAGYQGKIYLISTEKSPEIIDAALEAGADGYLNKPYRPEQVAALLGVSPEASGG